MKMMASACAPRSRKVQRGGAHRRFVDRLAQGAVGERALVDLEAQVAIGDRREVAPQAPGPPPVAAAHLQHVAEAAGGDDADLGTAALEQRIGADGGAVHDRAYGVDIAERAQALHEAQGFVTAAGRDLGGAEAPGRLVEQEQIREGAADVDADDAAGTSVVGRPMRRGTRCAPSPRWGEGWGEGARKSIEGSEPLTPPLSPNGANLGALVAVRFRHVAVRFGLYSSNRA